MTTKRIDRKTAAARLREAGAVCILMHDHPDGDTLGSAYALAHALHALGKPVQVLCADPAAAMFAYMQQGLPLSSAPLPASALLAAVDAANESLLGETLEQTYKGKIDLNIDHHATNAIYAAENLVDPHASACAEIIHDVIDAMGVEMNAQMAACLYAGISTDTGCFRYSNTTAHSHRCAARYMELGVDTEQLDRVFFETVTKTYLALERMAFDGLRYYCGGRVALVTVSQEMFRSSGSNEDEYIKIVARARQIEGVLAGVSIREKSNGSYKISVRTHEPLSAAAIAGRMGGGGHLRAAGCASTLPLEETVAKVVRCIEAELEGLE